MQTQERIIQKAQDLFLKYGIRSVTMDEIASQLGMSKKTLYQFVADKDELVDAVAKNHISLNQKRCECDRCLADNAIHQIFLTIEMVEEMMVNMNPAVFNDLQKYHSKSYERFNNHRNTFLYDFVKDNLVAGIEEGLYRDNINIEVMTKLRLETIFLPFNP
ncbi:MAG: TetR/AcrR family transcriptional regulator, partial [Segetibacter sp.]|nr:TetR/AcrR family transcriptional regulator [Segetibacter sp.]